MTVRLSNFVFSRLELAISDDRIAPRSRSTTMATRVASPTASVCLRQTRGRAWPPRQGSLSLNPGTDGLLSA